MPLRITKAEDTIKVNQLTVAIYGSPGVGKTTLAFTAKNPLLLDFDSGAYRSANRQDAVQISSWADVNGIAKDDLKDYSTIIVDTAGRCLDALTVDIIAKNPKMGRGGALTLQGYGELKARFTAWLKLLRSFGCDVVLIAHSAEERDGDELIERLDMQGASKNEVYKSADAMGRIFIRGNDRILNFSPSGAQFGKNPGQLEPLAVPDVSDNPDFLGEVIDDIKMKLNEMSETQKAELSRIAVLKESFEAMNTVDEFNETRIDMKDAPGKDKALLVDVAMKKGFMYKQGEGFIEPDPAAEDAA